MFRHGYTYSGHAAVSAAALANLDIIEREGLLDRAKTLEGELADGARRRSRSTRWSARCASGTGVLAAVQIDAGGPTRTIRRSRAGSRSPRARHGIMSRALAPGALQISPPLVLEHG